MRGKRPFIQEARTPERKTNRKKRNAAGRRSGGHSDRIGVLYKCSVCKKLGHNIRTCPNGLVPLENREGIYKGLKEIGIDITDASEG